MVLIKARYLAVDPHGGDSSSASPDSSATEGVATRIAETYAVFMAGRLPTNRIAVLNENDNYGSPDERGSTGVSIDQWLPRLTWAGVCPMNRLSVRVRWAWSA